IAPNLVQTMEGTPALVHAGPFANIAHGTSSVLAAQIARKTADYVITEAGFGADLGAEKFFDIVCRHADLWPSAVVLVVTGRAIKRHGGVPTKPSDLLTRPQPEAFRKGLANVDRHLANLRRFGVSVVVAMNRFPWDTPDEIEMLRAFCDEREVAFATHEAFAQGGAGAIDLAETVVAVADANPAPTPRFLYDLAASPEEKIEAIATEIYGASGIYFEKRARKKLERFVDLGFGGLPVCMAKTQSSLSDNGRLLGAPTGWQLTVSDVNLSAGAGFLVVVCGDMLLMPGLPRVPAAAGIDVDDAGRITGLF
ncbi:MAG: formate--tetrahydrofolate ligase, partial [Bacteroidota bacterium]